MSEYLGKIDKAYGGKEIRRVMSVEDCEIPKAEPLCLDDLATWAADAVRGSRRCSHAAFDTEFGSALDGFRRGDD